MGVTPVSAPRRVRERLRTAPNGPLRVVHRGLHAVYVEVGGRCVGVVDSRATAVPCALRTRTGDLAHLDGRSAYLQGGVLHLGETPLVVGRIADVRVPRFARERGTRITADPATARTTPPAAVTGSDRCLQLTGPLDAGAAQRLVGRGDGLTPLGDDILCGWLATHRAAGVATPSVDAAVRALMPRTTLLSATLLDCAMHGEVLPEFAAYVASLGTADEPAAAAALAAVGHTSGSGLLYGAHLALAELHHPIGAVA